MTTEVHPFISAFRGSFSGILRWPQLDELWATIRNDNTDSWYIYAIGETPPVSTSSQQKLFEFIDAIDKLLHDEHQEDYCGVVYVDDREKPTFIKIFDPNNLGVTCGFSDNPPLPGWILTRMQPIDLPSALPGSGNRRRWWQRIFAS